MSEKFSLKDHLFNREKVTYIAGNISEVFPEFKTTEFIESIVSKFPTLELKQRIVCIREAFKTFLPTKYTHSVQILLQSLPEELDPTNTDDDFGDFILAPYSDFIAVYGCTSEYLEFSLSALKEITKRFSVEFSIRYFLNAFPEETMLAMSEWSMDKNYHVRRLSSEGTRPTLPWGQKVQLDPEMVIGIVLQNLYADNTRYVVRSVANHLNDISKNNPQLVLDTLTKWKIENNASKKQNQKEFEYLVSHSLRTLVKKGNSNALVLLGYNPSPSIGVINMSLANSIVHIGDALEFSFSIVSHATEKLMIDYVIGFVGKNGTITEKVFKIKKCTLKKKEPLRVTKKHPLRIMTTKKLYPGTHFVSLQINGMPHEYHEFELVV